MPKPKTSAKKAANLVDKQLERYRSMRDFKVTEEPSGSHGAGTASGSLPFVVQKHSATRLHYDFRLGWNGVLKSWAVAKGPSYSTKDKRLAIQVEDHPMEYGGFEGIIPKGQYGGGTVMVWDTGTWEPQPGHTNVDEGLRNGSLKFTLHGSKLKGNWALIRMNGRAAGKDKPQWLLIKEHDPYERSPDDPDVLAEEPDSALTGRSLEAIAKSSDHIWNSDHSNKAKRSRATIANTAGDAKLARSKTRKPTAERSQPSHRRDASLSFSQQIQDFPKERLPSFVPPELATKTSEPPEGFGWLHELKLDGYRIQAHKRGKEVKLLTRTGLDWTHRMQSLAEDLTRLPAETAILDGELVVLAKNGTTSFADLQASFQEGALHRFSYFVFDILHLDGRNLRNATLIDRKSLLSPLLDNLGESVKVSEHIETNGATFFQEACKLHAEGIVSKRSSARYISGRSNQWLKIKCANEHEFVIGGFTLPTNQIKGVGALLLGYYNSAGKLIYAGRTGTGFTRATHSLLRNKLDAIRIQKSPFDSLPTGAERKVVWVKPTLVAQVSFATWTADNLVRQAAFKGLREDKPAKEVRRETDAFPAKQAISKSVKAQHRTEHARAAKRTPAPKQSKLPDEKDVAPIHLSHPDKIVDPDSGLTKQQLADYYWSVAKYMLPYIANRPLSLVRCPDGTAKPCFFQKHTNHMLPEGIEAVSVPDKKTGKPEPYITLSTPEALAGLAQVGVLEVHPWGSTNDDLMHPDRIVFDLDPDEAVSWSTLSQCATESRDLLEQLGLEAFLKTTGGKGLHIVVPIVAEYKWAIVKTFAQSFAAILEQRHPSLYLTKMSKAARKGRIFIDYLRNDWGATAIAAYSPRARAGVPVALPLEWSELKSKSRPRFTVSDFKSWKARLFDDPWKRLATTKQRLRPEDLEKLR